MLSLLILFFFQISLALKSNVTMDDVLEAVRSVQSDLHSLRSEVHSLRSEMHSEIHSLRSEVVKGFSSLHDFGRERVKAIESTSTPISFKNSNCSGVGTRHAVYYDGRVAEIFTPHFSCADPVKTKEIFLNSGATDDFHDLALLFGCPTKAKVVLNITTFTTPLLGDDVISFGFGDESKVWKGTVADLPTDSDCKDFPNNPWHGTASYCPDEYITTSFQHEGQSGGAVANGCGYVGIVHGTVRKRNTTFSSHATIIGAKVIIALMRKHFDKCARFDSCFDLTTVSLPVVPFMNCEHSQFRLMEKTITNDS
jgi:hypothetical protein